MHNRLGLCANYCHIDIPGLQDSMDLWRVHGDKSRGLKLLNIACNAGEKRKATELSKKWNYKEFVDWTTCSRLNFVSKPGWQTDYLQGSIRISILGPCASVSAGLPLAELSAAGWFLYKAAVGLRWLFCRSQTGYLRALLKEMSLTQAAWASRSRFNFLQSLGQAEVYICRI